jgi:two-component system phosphate regulon response regulator PhoB
MQNNQSLILMTSGLNTEADRVMGLEVGADDYLVKPFGYREFLARCRALLRRHPLSGAAPIPEKFECCDLKLFPDECRASRDGNDIKLSPKEFKLLELFMQHPKRVWSRDELLDQIWGIDYIGDKKTVDVHIRWLREKIEVNPSSPAKIFTVRGFGYRFC